MARKVKEVIIAAEGRDKGKRFVLTEMAASRAEKWGVRATLALSQSGIAVPPDVMGMGMAALLRFGLEAVLMMAHPEADALMAEMMTCVQFAPDPNNPAIVRKPIEDGINDEIEEVATRLMLRSEVFELHTGFSIAASLRARAAAKETDEATSNT